jgi:SAM-dependent methyltransferase
MTTEHRFYGDWATWWPLISPVEDYASEAAYLARLLRAADPSVTTVLELGSGGGHNAAHLKRDFRMTLTDLAEDMLALSRRLNPECEHIQGDMRSLRLGRTFDAVFVHDAVDYMTTEEDLSAAMATAFVHCRHGGIALFVPDHVRETFEPDTDHDGRDDACGRGVRYLQWTYDPDPTDTSVVTEYAFLFREADGRVAAHHETHRTGLFDRATWLRLLGDAGFVATRIVEETDEDRTPRDIFVGRKL